ncbi:MAG: replicative DNA helicase, partial [Clostridia bacterium]|nr:replicative DNA helicase [Clostridia bacterium]
MKNEFNKQLPFSLEAEQAVLGSILIDPENFKEISSFLYTDDFYIEEHKNIYSAMRTLSLDKNRTIDVVTLINALVENGVYDETSGKEYIKKICEMVPTSANLVDYANIVKDKS